MPSPTDLNRLQVFREVVQAGSFSKAALVLKQPKSRVSRNISLLERELGVQLIYRTTRQFQLTEAGQNLFQKATPLLNELDNTLEQLTTEADEISGPVRVTVPDDFGSELMGKICHEFILQYPKVHIHLIQSNETLDLVKESIDVAVRVGKIKSSTLIQRKIGVIELVFVMSPGLLQASGPLQKFEDLEKWPFLGFSAFDSKRLSVRSSNGKESKQIKLSPKFVCNNFFPIRQMALAGSGVALLPVFLVRDLIGSGQLVQVFKEWTAEGNPVHVMIPHQKEPPLRMKKFVEFLASRLSQYL